jgi:Protein of Unknown function (DUF2784)
LTADELRQVLEAIWNRDGNKLTAIGILNSIMLLYRLAADAVVVIHMAYVLTVILGLPALWWGVLWKQEWVRNPWLRIGHLSMILIVVVEAWAGITCPLTTWEYQFRELAGDQKYQGAFFANLVHDWLFFDLDPLVFTVLYSAFGALVAASFVLAPPRWKRRPS